MPLSLPLVTERLVLRLHRPGDLDAFAAIYSDPRVARFLLDEPWTPELAEARLAQRVSRTGLDEVRALALVVEAGGEVAGDVALWLTDDTGSQAEIGWVIAPAFAGRGFATEAARAVADAGFAGHGLHRIAAQMDARNAASARVCERLGMTREAHLRQNWWCKGEWTDTLVYGLLATDRA